MTEVSDASAANHQFPGNRRRVADPTLKFGQYGELTPEVIEQADMSDEARARAYEILEAQQAYLEIIDTLSYPVDPDGNTYDLNMLGPTKLAIAWTLALAGFQRTGKQQIKKRYFSAPGCYEDAHTWVDVRQPDTAAEELQPNHRASDVTLPPDTRRLAAIRDGEPPMEMPAGWHTEPKVVRTTVRREDV